MIAQAIGTLQLSEALLLDELVRRRRQAFKEQIEPAAPALKPPG